LTERSISTSFRVSLFWAICTTADACDIHTRTRAPCASALRPSPQATYLRLIIVELISEGAGRVPNHPLLMFIACFNHICMHRFLRCVLPLYRSAPRPLLGGAVKPELRDKNAANWLELNIIDGSGLPAC
jgi:hypothetical protein